MITRERFCLRIMENLLYRVGTISRKYVSPILKKMRIYKFVTRIYTMFLFHLSGNTAEIGINGVSFSMLTETRDEYNIINFGLRTEENEIKRFLQDINDSDIIWDVGGHIGFWSCAAAEKIGAEGEVIAFEPVPVNRERLIKNSELNNSRIDVRDVALSNKRGETVLAVPENKIGVSMGSLMREEVDDKKIDVTMERGDAIDAPLSSMMKIDVEGAELSVLEGMGEKLDTCRVLYIEVHPELLPDNQSEDAVKNFLSSNGYEIEYLSERDITNTYTIRASRD